LNTTSTIHGRGSKTPFLLLVLYTGVLLYGTLWPFRFTWHPGRDQMSSRRRIEWIPFSRPCPTHGLFCPRDTGLNVAMFIPWGALAALAFEGRGGVLRRVVRAGVLGFALSLLIETTQYFIPARFPSTTDLLLNTLGAGLGGLMVAGVGHIRQKLKN
jgi:glycopeptide antibiotics resistance protein